MFDSEPVSDMEERTTKLSDAKHLSKLDCAMGFRQIPLDNSSKEMTAFSIPSMDHFQCSMMPFGLINSPATFSKLMCILLKDLRGVAYFVGDILGVFLYMDGAPPNLVEATATIV